MSVIDWAKDNPLLAGAAVFGIGAIAVIVLMGGKEEPDPGVALSIGPSALEVQAGTALAIAQAQTSAQVAIADKQAAVAKSYIDSQSAFNMAGLGILLEREVTTRQANAQEYAVISAKNQQDYARAINFDSLNHNATINLQNLTFQQNEAFNLRAVDLARQSLGAGKNVNISTGQALFAS